MAVKERGGEREKGKGKSAPTFGVEGGPKRLTRRSFVTPPLYSTLLVQSMPAHPLELTTTPLHPNPPSSLLFVTLHSTSLT